MPQLFVIALFLLGLPFYRDVRKWVLHVCIFSIPVNLPILRETLTTADLFLAVMFFILFSDVCFGQRGLNSWDWLKGSVLLFGVVILLSVSGSEFKIKSLRPISYYIKAIILFFYILHYIDSREVGELFWVFILSGIIPALLGIWTDWAAVRSLTERSSYFIRAISTFSGPVEFGYQMAIRAIVLIALPWKFRSFRINILKASLVFIFLLSVAISFTRNSYIAIILGVIIVGGFRGWNMIKRWGIKGISRFGTLAVIISFFLWLVIPHRIVARLGMLRLGGIDPSIFARPQLWGAAWQMFLDHPINGVGFGAFPSMFIAHYVPHSFPQFAKVGFVSAHNLIFMTLSELGILGAVSLSILFGSFCKKILHLLTKVQDPWRGYLLTCLTLGICSLAFGLFDFVWVQERTATSMGFILSLAALSIYAASKHLTTITRFTEE